MVKWDWEKAAANLWKHGVDFADAVAAVEDEWAIETPDDHPEEERWVAIGMDGLGRVLVVVYSWRDGEMRLISARRSNPRERRRYSDRRT